jgi:hypothetical protein
MKTSAVSARTAALIDECRRLRLQSDETRRASLELRNACLEVGQACLSSIELAKARSQPGISMAGERLDIARYIAAALSGHGFPAFVLEPNQADTVTRA